MIFHLQTVGARYFTRYYSVAIVVGSPSSSSSSFSTIREQQLHITWGQYSRLWLPWNVLNKNISIGQRQYIHEIFRHLLHSAQHLVVNLQIGHDFMDANFAVKGSPKSPEKNVSHRIRVFLKFYFLKSSAAAAGDPHSHKRPRHSISLVLCFSVSTLSASRLRWYLCGSRGGSFRGR